MNLPDPLHPAVVHFPIVLILLGALAALLALRARPPWLALVATVLLGLGSLGAAAARFTGEEAEEQAKATLTDESEILVEHHEEWATRTLAWAVAATIAGILAMLASRRNRPASSWPDVLRLLSVLLAIAASYAVIRTGHLGGEMVYRRGIGVQVTQGGVPTAAPATATRHERDDD